GELSDSALEGNHPLAPGVRSPSESVPLRPLEAAARAMARPSPPPRVSPPWARARLRWTRFEHPARPPAPTPGTDAARGFRIEASSFPARRSGMRTARTLNPVSGVAPP